MIIIKGIEIIWFHIMQLLLTVLNKNKWILGKNKRKLSHWYKYLFKRYPLHHSTNKQLEYIISICKLSKKIKTQRHNMESVDGDTLSLGL